MSSNKKQTNVMVYTIKHKFPLALLFFLYLCLGVVIYHVKTDVVVIQARDPIVLEIIETKLEEAQQQIENVK